MLLQRTEQSFLHAPEQQITDLNCNKTDSHETSERFWNKDTCKNSISGDCS